MRPGSWKHPHLATCPLSALTWLSFQSKSSYLYYGVKSASRLKPQYGIPILNNLFATCSFHLLYVETDYKIHSLEWTLFYKTSPLYSLDYNVHQFYQLFFIWKPSFHYSSFGKNARIHFGQITSPYFCAVKASCQEEEWMTQVGPTGFSLFRFVTLSRLNTRTEKVVRVCLFWEWYSDGTKVVFWPFRVLFIAFSLSPLSLAFLWILNYKISL